MILSSFYELVKKENYQPWIQVKSKLFPLDHLNLSVHVQWERKRLLKNVYGFFDWTIFLK